MRYEVRIGILAPTYIDSLIVSLVRQGYDVYYNEDEKVVCYTADETELTAIKYEKIILNDA